MRVMSPLLFSSSRNVSVQRKGQCRRGNRLCVARSPDATISNLSGLVWERENITETTTFC